jgi:ankyrin repeat protein
MQDTKLLDECKAGNIDAVRSLITDNANLNAVTDDESPLLVAIEANNLDLVDVLLQAGADPARVTDSGETALMAASRCGHLEIVYHLLQRQPAALLNIRDDELEHTALLLAIKHNKLDVASALFDAGADATIASDCGTTTLMVCSDVPLAEKLLDLGVDVHAQDGEGMNAFLIACRDGNVKLVSLLLARGADVYSHDGEDRTGLMLACSMGHAEVATLLLKLNTSPPVDEDEWNAWLHSGDRDEGVTALHMAVLGGHAGCVQALVAAGFNVNKLDDDSVPPLSHAVNAEIARILLDAGAKDLQGGCRKRAVVLACEEPKRIEVLRLLLQRFPNCDHPDRPLLFFAVEARNLDAVRALVTARPPEYINKQDSAGCTALAYARHPEVVQLLLELGTDPRIVNNTGKTPLMFGGSAARVRLLLEAAPDTVRVRDNAGRTAMSHLCLSPRHLDALDELLRYCA